MKIVIIFLLLTISVVDLFAQTDSALSFIFIPHPRSEDHENPGVNPQIASIDFSKYDVKMLGGDLTFNTDRDSATLALCDSIFDLGNPNTLWSFGNHDVSGGHRSLLKEFTERESFYTFARDGITFMVLDTELDANGSSSTFIKDEQLQMVEDVCDSISESLYLIILHHRFMWMINNDYFESRLTDSVAASSRYMDTTNFYSDIYPLLQKVKNKGILVLVFGGDRCNFNVEYSPEDSITFYAAALSVDLPDSLENVIVLKYDLQKKELKTDFVPLVEDTVTTNVKRFSSSPGRFILYQNYPNPFNPVTMIKYQIPKESFVSVKVYDVIGNEVADLVNEQQKSGYYELLFDAGSLSSGVYFYRISSDNYTAVKKMLLLK